MKINKIRAINTLDIKYNVIPILEYNPSSGKFESIDSVERVSYDVEEVENNNNFLIFIIEEKAFHGENCKCYQEEGICDFELKIQNKDLSHFISRLTN